jgi:hypothetical protein
VFPLTPFLTVGLLTLLSLHAIHPLPLYSPMSISPYPISPHCFAQHTIRSFINSGIRA